MPPTHPNVYSSSLNRRPECSHEYDLLLPRINNSTLTSTLPAYSTASASRTVNAEERVYPSAGPSSMQSPLPRMSTGLRGRLDTTPFSSVVSRPSDLYKGTTFTEDVKDTLEVYLPRDRECPSRRHPQVDRLLDYQPTDPLALGVPRIVPLAPGSAVAPRMRKPDAQGTCYAPKSKSLSGNSKLCQVRSVILLSITDRLRRRLHIFLIWTVLWSASHSDQAEVAHVSFPMLIRPSRIRQRSGPPMTRIITPDSGFS